jgi:hypothetical protein
MQQPGLDHRHRDKNGEISRKHGNTLIRTLRETYGHGARCTVKNPAPPNAGFFHDRAD